MGAQRLRASAPEAVHPPPAQRQRATQHATRRCHPQHADATDHAVHQKRCTLPRNGNAQRAGATDHAVWSVLPCLLPPLAFCPSRAAGPRIATAVGMQSLAFAFLLPLPATASQVVVADALNVRAEARADAPIVARLRIGTWVTVTQNVDAWSEILGPEGIEIDESSLHHVVVNGAPVRGWVLSEALGIEVSGRANDWQTSPQDPQRDLTRAQRRAATLPDDPAQWRRLAKAYERRNRRRVAAFAKSRALGMQEIFFARCVGGEVLLVAGLGPNEARGFSHIDQPMENPALDEYAKAPAELLDVVKWIGLEPWRPLSDSYDELQQTTEWIDFREYEHIEEPPTDGSEDPWRERRGHYGASIGTLRRRATNHGNNGGGELDFHIVLGTCNANDEQSRRAWATAAVRPVQVRAALGPHLAPMLRADEDLRALVALAIGPVEVALQVGERPEDSPIGGLMVPRSILSRVGRRRPLELETILGANVIVAEGWFGFERSGKTSIIGIFYDSDGVLLREDSRSTVVEFAPSDTRKASTTVRYGGSGC